MNPRIRRSFVLLLILGSFLSVQAQGPAKDWEGEWGAFTHVAASGHLPARYEGTGLSITDCDGQKCYISFEILGDTAQAHAEGKGDLLATSTSEAIAEIGFNMANRCTLVLEKTGSVDPSITAKVKSGNCSEFATPGASFEHEYTLRSRAVFYAEDIPECFAGGGRAQQVYCTSVDLSLQEPDWMRLVLEVSELQPQGLNAVAELAMADAELARIIQSCDAAPEAEACMKAAFTKSADDLKARKDAWKASVTDPGDPGKAKQAIAAIEGSYRKTFDNGDVDGEHFKSTDTLEIRRISDTVVHVKVYLEFFNGHECGHEGNATYRQAGIFTDLVQDDQGKLCAFEVVPTATGVQLEDPTGMCRMTDCGMRGGYNGAAFLFSERIKSGPPAQAPSNSR